MNKKRIIIVAVIASITIPIWVPIWTLGFIIAVVT